MTASNTILVDVDPTAESHPAVDRGIWLAKHYDAGLELFICDYDPYLAGEKARESLLKDRRERLATLAAKVEAAGVPVTTDVVWDHPIDAALLRKAAESSPLMLVKDTHFHPILKRTLFSNTDWGLIRDCPVDLLLVKPEALGDSVKVLAAVDPLHDHDKPAELDRRILSTAKSLAERTNAQLSVFHSFDPMPAIAGASTTMGTPIAVPAADITAEMQDKHGKALSDLTDEFGLSEDQLQLHQGLPRDLLPAIAEKLDADIVVMGAVSRRGLKRIFIGHTAEQVLDYLPCDLLIVKPAGFAERVSGSVVAA